ncbi:MULTISPECIES: SDR family NAD(P)-dependent oxidoreductase [Bacillus]|uniref:SDR family NAD(P)-dependent oxidoreductase n=1 Tax=Bacillus TaxID=1386 RepID=UPI000C756336|nr:MULTISPECIES: SDR family NAD(P)-dependent oxidoreductase [Bacillus]PLR87828.1 oxidoreductase [Bacillus sp. V33-4]RSK55278.1 SDR family oxidoreductase [Bacillus canaveralius]
MSFSDKVVLVTGAAAGIGKESVKAFADQGAKVVLVDLDIGTLKATAKELELQEGNYLLVAADVSKEEEVEQYVQKTVEQFGSIDVFFNNAGVEGKVLPITDYPAETLDLVLNVNVKGVFFGLKHVLRIMKEQKSGAVINNSSVAGLSGSPNVSAYIASKHAVIGLTKAAAVEVAQFGVRVNAVCPSPVNTRMMRSLESGFSPDDAEAAKEQLTQTIPLKRYGESADVANLVLFLASEQASFITGVACPVDGGLTAQ